MVIIAWIVFYTIASFSSELPWGSCLHDFNTNGKLETKHLVRRVDFNVSSILLNCAKTVTALSRTNCVAQTIRGTPMTRSSGVGSA